jgi:hypothetical protein
VGGDLQTVDGGAAVEQVREVDEERPVDVDCVKTAVTGSELVAKTSVRVTIPAAAR